MFWRFPASWSRRSSRTLRSRPHGPALLLIVLLSLPLFLADEVLIRPIPSRWKAAGIVLLTRAMMSAVAITAALVWNREAVFLALIIHLLLILWMALWFCAGTLYRRTADPFSAAFFVSLLQAWLFASCSS